jgi:hypothetical protein
MQKALVNGLIVVAVLLLCVWLASLTGSTAINGGLGPDGPAYSAMLTDHDITRGSANTRMVPALLLFAAVPYAVIGDVVLSFRIANFVALALLVLAGCLILDEVSAPTVVKACAAFTLAVMALPAAVFDPIQPYLVAVALTALAVALAGIDDGPPEALVAIAHVGATLAAPAGIIAPLYGLVRRWRIGRRDLASLFAFVPALLIWLAIQFWARGGLLGLADLVRPARVAGDTVMRGEGAFAMLGLFTSSSPVSAGSACSWWRAKAPLGAPSARDRSSLPRRCPCRSSRPPARRAEDRPVLPAVLADCARA